MFSKGLEVTRSSPNVKLCTPLQTLFGIKLAIVFKNSIFGTGQNVIAFGLFWGVNFFKNTLSFGCF